MTETANSDEKKLLSVATRSDAQLWLCAKLGRAVVNQIRN